MDHYFSGGRGGGEGFRNFLLQMYFFNICAASIIFFQSHHLENNFYPDFFFGAKTINSANCEHLPLMGAVFIDKMILMPGLAITLA